MSNLPLTSDYRVRVPRWLIALAERMSRTSPMLVLAVLAVIRIASVGIYTTPNLDQFVLFARHPFGATPLFGGSYYITGSPLGPLLAHVLHMQTTLTYPLLHFGVLVAGTVVLTIWMERTAGRAAATGVVVLLFASPLSNVLLTWLGQPDVFVVVAGGMIAVATDGQSRLATWFVAVGAGFALGFSSAETGLLALVALALVGAAASHNGRVVLAMATLGLLAGRLGVSVFHAVSDIPYQSRLSVASETGYYTLFRRAVYNLPALLYSTFGAAWLLVAAWLSSLRTSRRPFPWGAVLAWLIAVASAFVALDQTRVSTLILWPASVWVAYTSLRARERDAGAWLLLAATVVVATLVPPLFVWNGGVQGASFLNWFKTF